jgi:voltage-gated potassium channel Kch
MTDKWGRWLFKAGGLMLVLLGLVHSLSLFGKPVGANDTERQLLELMASYKFDLAGSPRSMAELMRGFSVAFMLAAIGLGVLDLLLAAERAPLLKRIALLNGIWLATMTATSLRYFFVFPTAFLGTALLIFAAAWLKLPSEQTN